MKRIYLLLTMIIGLTFTCHAKVALLVVGDSDADTALPFDGYWIVSEERNDPVLSPERATYTWFNNSYTTSQDKTRILIGSLQAAESSVPEDVDVLWINLDRNEDAISFESVDQNYDNIFNSNVVTALSNFVKRGGNLLLTKQAARIVKMIGRTALYPTCEISWIQKEDPGPKIAYTQKVVPTHKIFAGTGEDSNYNLVSTYYPTSRESLWDNLNTAEDRSNFETDNTCKILGYNDDDNKKAGIVEFYPKGDYKGTVLVIGVCGYQWCPDAETPVNEHLPNVKQLTQNALDYLTATSKLSVSASANPVICAQEDITVSGDYLTPVSYATTDANVANIHADGRIYYNYFGDVTFTVNAEGDGIHIPKNIVSASVTRTVTGGDTAKATYGYVLTYSLHTLDAENLKPDYTAAKWFYDNYVSRGTGCFINPTDYSSTVDIPSAIKVLWVHSDKWNLASEAYYTALGGDDFREALKNYIKAGGNAFLSKQATRLIKDIGRARYYPCYEFAGSENSDDASDTWYMTDDFNWGIGVSRHWHRAFRFMTGYRTDDNVSHWPLVSGASPYNRTDHWYLWGQSRNDSHVRTETWNEYDCEGDCGFNQKGRLTNFESKQKCTILGGWGHTANLDAVGMAEFYPATVSETDFKGSVITMGLGAYQWTTDNTCANMANLTKGVLEYLTDVPFVIHHNGDSEGDPREVNNYKETYAGGKIGTTIEYRMKVNALDQWYSLYLPFDVDSVCVWDTGDSKYYKIEPYYRPEVSDALIGGHYLIRTPVTATNLSLANFGDWRDPTTYKWVPSKNTPYIIQWHLAYFSNKYISFFGHTDEDEEIPDAMTVGAAPSLDNVVNVYGNNAMKNGSVAGAYLLEGDYGSYGAWLRDENPDAIRTILPFECYIVAKSTTLARYRVLRRGMSIEETATGWEDVINSERKTCVEVYTITGYRLTQYNDYSFSETAQRLNAEYGAGMYILRAGNESVKLMLEGGK